MEERRWEEDAEVRKILWRGWRLGAEDFLDRLEDRIQSQLTDDHDGQQVADNGIGGAVRGAGASRTQAYR